MKRTYLYVGPKDIVNRADSSSSGTVIKSERDVLNWLERSNQQLNPNGEITVTFVIDETGNFRIADRHSEHVACAGCRPVQSAGEMTFTISSDSVIVSWVSNQSTGYCPEPESWLAVESSLKDAGIESPPGFSLECIFRRCIKCGSINIVKDDFFECSVCASELPQQWNFDAQ